MLSFWLCPGEDLMLGVHKTDDPSKAPAMQVLAPRAAGATVREPKLLDRLRDALRSRHYSRPTEHTYPHSVKRFIYFHHDDDLDPCPEPWRQGRQESRG